LRTIMEPLTKILSASMELFRQYGFKTITMDDIARRAGISKKTLYQHFANKNEVVNESVSWFQEHVSDSCISIMNEADNAIEGMVRVMGMFDNVLRNMNPLALLELERYYPDGYQKFRANMMAKDIEAIKNNVLWGMKEGLYRDTLDAEFIARYRMEVSMLVLHPNLMINSRNDLKFVMHEVSEHFLYGIMTPKGEKLYQKYKEQYLKQVSNI
jgi:TetR/AcrR family transcriptional regulator, cholesterol catabolism regulator